MEITLASQVKRQKMEASKIVLWGTDSRVIRNVREFQDAMTLSFKKLNIKSGSLLAERGIIHNS